MASRRAAVSSFSRFCWSWRSAVLVIATSTRYDQLTASGRMAEVGDAREETFTVAFLGPKGSYCHQVCFRSILSEEVGVLILRVFSLI